MKQQNLMVFVCLFRDISNNTSSTTWILVGALTLVLLILIIILSYILFKNLRKSESYFCDIFKVITLPSLLTSTTMI